VKVTHAMLDALQRAERSFSSEYYERLHKFRDELRDRIAWDMLEVNLKSKDEDAPKLTKEQEQRLNRLTDDMYRAAIEIASLDSQHATALAIYTAAKEEHDAASAGQAT
jgi:hypothetical protein